MTSQTTSTTGALIQSTVAQLLVQPLEAASIILAAGPTILDTNNPLRVPRLVSGTTAAFTAESTAITEGTATFDEIDLLPSTLKAVKTIVRVSSEAVRSSVIGLSAVLQQRLVTDVAQAIDSAFISGTGTSNTIKGILNQTGIATGTYDLTDPTTYLAALATAAGNNVTPTHWILNAQDWYTLAAVKDTTHRPIVEPNVASAAAAQLFGLPVIVTNKLATGHALLLDIKQVVIARDLAPSVTVLDQTYGASDEIGIRVTARFDLGLLHPVGVTHLTPAA